MMNPSTQGATFMQYNNNNKGGGGGGLYGIPANPSHHHNQNLLLVGNPIHDFLQMQQNPTAFPARYLINAENDSKNPPQHLINTNENEQHQQELQKKQQRTKRWKSSSDDETSDKDNFGQQQRAGVVGN